MSWVRLDDHMSEHPKVIAAGPLAAWLHVCALQYASRNLTDGFIPRRAVPTLVNFDGVSVCVASISGGLAGVGDDVHAEALAEILVEVGLWERVDRGYQIHDYLQFQPSKESILAQRRQNAERQATWRGRQHQAENNAPRNGVTNAATNAVTNGPVTGAPYPVPVPLSTSSPENTPEGKEGGVGGDASAAAAAPSKPRAVSKPNRVSEVIDALREQGLDVALSKRDMAEVKGSTAKPSEIAEAYAAVHNGEWGDEWLRENLSVQAVIHRIGGYRASRVKRVARPKGPAPPDPKDYLKGKFGAFIRTE